ncbi:MAG TPA: phosphoribosylformylglycinamidine cyclo-ligase, partial [Gemmatimonadetes bacterium]|nr:phosphoribosylformylglycinamidine cyclo-ligase [Gemmatimonadota bacterium]
AMAHITGGGLTGNVPRVLPEGCTARIDPDTWPVPPIFTFLRERGDVPVDEMYRTFNMGIGMALVCAKADVSRVIAKLIGGGEVGAAPIGEIREGSPAVEYAHWDR